MAATYKVLGQSFPAAATQTTLYTVPAATSTVCSTLSVCNKAGAGDTVTVRICVAGAADNDKQLIMSGATIGANSLFTMTIGITLAATDVVKVTSTNGTSAFQLFGQELT